MGANRPGRQNWTDTKNLDGEKYIGKIFWGKGKKSDEQKKDHQKNLGKISKKT